MSDIADTTTAPAEAAPESSAPLPVGALAPSGSTDPGGTDVLDGDLPVDRAVFDRGYVESVRREAQRYREEARTAVDQFKSYDDVFGVYDADDRQVWFNLAQTWANNPGEAAEIMKQIAAAVLADDNDQQENQVADATDFDLSPSTPTPDVNMMTPEQVQQMIDAKLGERDTKQAEQKAIDEIFGEVRAAGFDPVSAEGHMVLYNANHHTGGDIAKAVEMTKTYKQAIIDDYVQGRSTNRYAMPTSQNGVQATAAGEPITSLEDAKRATDAYLRERRTAT